MSTLETNNYDKLKKYDYDLYRKTIQFSFGVTENIKLIVKHELDIKAQAYIEKEIIGFVVQLIEEISGNKIRD